MPTQAAVKAHREHFVTTEHTNGFSSNDNLSVYKYMAPKTCIFSQFGVFNVSNAAVSMTFSTELKADFSSFFLNPFYQLKEKDLNSFIWA